MKKENYNLYVKHFDNPYVTNRIPVKLVLSKTKNGISFNVKNKDDKYCNFELSFEELEKVRREK